MNVYLFTPVLKTGMKKTILFTLATCFSLLSWAQIDFNGQVKNAETSAPISAAYVRINNADNSYSAYTTPNGSFTIKNVTKGKYNISISHIGYTILVEDVLIETGVYELYFLSPDMEFLDAAIISTVRAKNTNPVTFTNLDKKKIETIDQSKDFPFLLNTTPSTVISSDAGNGVGYTGVRIRGIDPTRVNITINGIPLNDAESQGVYWVNLPDLASSTQSVQIQRGVGTSTNGAAAFGASVNIRTNDLPEKQTTKVNLGFGSFKTQRASLQYSSGRLKNNWSFQLRGSSITSDGFIDRASSDLKSANFAAAKYCENSVLKANVLLGKERTYQAWWGIPQPTFNDDIAEENRYINQLWMPTNEVEHLQNSNSKTYNFYTYENEVDNYNQNHYQLFFDHSIKPNIKLNTAAYITTGKGYFEQFKADEDLTDYGIPVQPSQDTVADVIRRRWLDNTLIGALASISYDKKALNATVGIGGNQYNGRHFGEAITTEYSKYEELNAIYYDNDGSKQDLNAYAKLSYNFKNLIPYLDVQVRAINYDFEGFDNQGDFAPQSVSYNFLNPKAGITYLLKNHTFYGVYARGNREPVRDDFRNSKPDEWPEHEQLDNIELGYRYSKKRTQLGVNFYNMDYTNQLVLTGQVNDVGEAIRVNVAESYRRGIEAEFQFGLSDQFQLGGNATLSQNKIASFTEQVQAWNPPYTPLETEYEDTYISFSPNQIFTGILSFRPSKQFSINAIAKHVGTQYLDNTQSEQRKLDAFNNLDVSFSYTNSKIKGLKSLNASLYLNNVLNQYYAPNGYTYSGVISGERADFNYLYPMAGFNWMMKLVLTL